MSQERDQYNKNQAQNNKNKNKNNLLKIGGTLLGLLAVIILGGKK